MVTPLSIPVFHKNVQFRATVPLISPTGGGGGSGGVVARLREAVVVATTSHRQATR